MDEANSGDQPATAPDLAQRVLAALGTDSTQAFVLLNALGQPVWASPSLFSVFDVDLAAVDPLMAALHPDDRLLVGEIFQSELDGPADGTFDLDRRYELVVRLRSPRGDWRFVALRLLNCVDDPAVDGMLLQLTLANQEHATVQAFDAASAGRPTEEVVSLVLDALHSGGTGDSQAAVFDLDGRCLGCTGGAGIRAGDHEHSAAWQAMSEGRVDVRTPVIGPDGTPIGTLVLVSNFPDVRPFTRSLAVAVARRVGLIIDADRTRVALRSRAQTDPLTGLWNRLTLLDHLERDDLGAHASAAFIDLNGFKAANDEHGHHVGDCILIEVARRLESLLGPGDVAARLGGDEFVLVRHAASAAQAALDPAEIAASIDGPIEAGDITVPVKVSVGVAIGAAGRPDELLRDADASMYRSKGRRTRRGDAPGSADHHERSDGLRGDSRG